VRALIVRGAVCTLHTRSNDAEWRPDAIKTDAIKHHQVTHGLVSPTKMAGVPEQSQARPVTLCTWPMYRCFLCKCSLPGRGQSAVYVPRITYLLHGTEETCERELIYIQTLIDYINSIHCFHPQSLIMHTPLHRTYACNRLPRIPTLIGCPVTPYIPTWAWP
jgi:hypothetical protein